MTVQYVAYMEYALSLLAGFFGSMHCVGMCGPIVLAYSARGLQPERTSLSTFTAHAAYNTGRILSYAIVGAIVGFLGKGISELRGIGYWFSLISGIVLILAGIVLLKIIPFARFSETMDFNPEMGSLFRRLYRLSFGALLRVPKIEAKFYIGLLTPLIPCGLLYSMVLKAAETGSPWEGGLMMVLFGMGIAPALIVAGYAGSYFGKRLRRWGDRLAAMAVLLMGVILVVRALGIGALLMGHHS